MIFHERLKQLRQEVGLTQAQAAEALHLNYRHYQRLEGDKSTPNFANLVQIADFFEVSMDFLAGRTDDRNGPILFLSECGCYTYLNRLHWDERLRVEIIHGFVIPKLTPPTVHQVVYGNLVCIFGNQIEKKSGCTFIGHLGVRPFEKPGDKPEDVDTFLVPDIQMVLDRSKFDEYGCIGPPDFIIEVLSPATRELDLGTKRKIYEEAGVTEYWAADPDGKNIQVYILENAKYRTPVVYTAQDTVPVGVLEDCQIDLAAVFEGV